MLLPSLRLYQVLVVSVTLHCPRQVGAASAKCTTGVSLHQRKVRFQPGNNYRALIQTGAAKMDRDNESSIDPISAQASTARDGGRSVSGKTSVSRRLSRGLTRSDCVQVQRECRGRPLGVFHVTGTTVMLSIFIGGVGVGVAGTLMALFLMGQGCGLENKSAVCFLSVSTRNIPATEETAAILHHGTASTDASSHGPGHGHTLSRALNELPSATEDLESMHLFWPRAGCLLGLFLVQSLSGLIMTSCDQLFKSNPVLVFFLTMIVGTGGNVGGQTVVMAVRKLALGEDVSIGHEAFVGVKLCAVLVPAAFIRCWAQEVSMPGSITVTICVLAVVVIGSVLGASLPKMLLLLSIDPAHATPMIQVVMDILGVCIICLTGILLLDNDAMVQKWKVR